MNVKKIVDSVKNAFKNTNIRFIRKEIIKDDDGSNAYIRVDGEFNTSINDDILADIFVIIDRHNCIHITYSIGPVRAKGKILNILNAFNRDTSAKAYLVDNNIYLDYDYSFEDEHSIIGTIMITKMRSFIGEYRSYYEKLRDYIVAKTDSEDSLDKLIS